MGFQPGDHVYIGRGLTGTVKHHAIVVAAEDSAGWFQIVEYGVYNPDGSKKLIAGHALEVVKENGDVRRCRVNAKKESWRLASEQNGNSAQTPAQVVAAAMFVLENKNLLPPYHITFCNGECVARWCKEGTFASGQASKLYNKISKASNDRAVPTIGAASTKVATMAVAVGAFVGKRHLQVGNTWAQTNQLLDEAFASYGGARCESRNDDTSY